MYIKILFKQLDIITLKDLKNIVKKYLITKEKISKKMMIAIKRIAFGYSDFNNF